MLDKHVDDVEDAGLDRISPTHVVAHDSDVPCVACCNLCCDAMSNVSASTDQFVKGLVKLVGVRTSKKKGDNVRMDLIVF